MTEDQLTYPHGTARSLYYCAGDFWPHDTSLWVKDFHGNDPRFIALLLRSMRLERYDAATSVPTLNRNTVHPILVSIPDVDEQRAIVRAFDSINLRVADEMALLAKLGASKQGLMDDLLTGACAC
jgi:type I restriction enzyme S subunit